jgi:heme O synthase-like polyprenyltransferase
MSAQALEDAVGLRRVIASAGQFVALTKPRVMSLAVFTAFVGLWIAPATSILLARRLPSSASHWALLRPGHSICGTTRTSMP